MQSLGMKVSASIRVSLWPSRDPIEEAGGLNLYGMVKNSPQCTIDFLGLSVFLFTENGSGSPSVIKARNDDIEKKRVEVRAAIEKAKMEGNFELLSFAWFDNNGKEQKLGSGKSAANEFLKRVEREKFLEVDAKAQSLAGDMQQIVEAKSDMEYKYDVVVYSKHGIPLENIIPYGIGDRHTIERVGMEFEAVLQTIERTGVLVICNPRQGGGTYEIEWPHHSVRAKAERTSRASGCDFEFYSGTAKRITPNKALPF